MNCFFQRLDVRKKPKNMQFFSHPKNQFRHRSKKIKYWKNNNVGVRLSEKRMFKKTKIFLFFIEINLIK